MPTETTLVLLKPDAVRRGLVAELIGRFERRGFRIRGLKQLVLQRSVAEEHYAEHSARPFFGELVDFMTPGPLVALGLAGVGGTRAAALLRFRRAPARRGMTLVLASRSPQRRAILTQLGLEFRVVEPSYDELPLPIPPHELAERHSLGKARSVEVRAGETVLGVDTLVVIDGQVLGKPADEAEAARMLALLGGKTHDVVSGLTLRDAAGERTAHARTA